MEGLAGEKGRSAEGSAASQVPENRAGVQKRRASKQDRRGGKRKWKLRFEQTCPQKSQWGENAQRIAIRKKLSLARMGALRRLLRRKKRWKFWEAGVRR